MLGHDVVVPCRSVPKTQEPLPVVAALGMLFEVSPHRLHQVAASEYKKMVLAKKDIFGNEAILKHLAQIVQPVNHAPGNMKLPFSERLQGRLLLVREEHLAPLPLGESCQSVAAGRLLGKLLVLEGKAQWERLKQILAIVPETVNDGLHASHSVKLGAPRGLPQLAVSEECREHDHRRFDDRCYGLNRQPLELVDAQERGGGAPRRLRGYDSSRSYPGKVAKNRCDD